VAVSIISSDELSHSHDDWYLGVTFGDTGHFSGVNFLHDV